MNRSLRFKLAVSLMTTVLTILLISVLINTVFLGDYYLSGKQNNLVDTFYKINEMYNKNTVNIQDNTVPSDVDSLFTLEKFYLLTNREDMELEMEKISQSKNIGILLYQIFNERKIDNKTVYDMQVLFSTSGNRVADDYDVKNFTMYKDYIQSEEKIDLKSTSKKYTLQKVKVNRLDSYYLYLIGNLDNEYQIMLRASVQGIEESAQISNRFFVYVTISLCIVGFIAMLFISERFTGDILNLAQIAQKMSRLDFQEKYRVRTKDEIGVLGESINTLSSTLEKTLGELKSANVQLKRELDQKVQIDEMRKEFLSNVSHELKTPIALIQGYAEGLQENINDDEESRQFYCDVIIDEASKMNMLVKKLLDLNQLEFGTDTLTMEHFDIVSTINNILLNSEILFRQKEVTLIFEAEDPVYVWGDVYLVEEVFSNYLSNALNHVDHERIIEVRIQKLKDRARISVFNTGNIIPDEDIPQIWTKFYKVDKARTREYGGSGVGLSIVKASMERLGQNYGIVNHENGVEFWFMLDMSNKIKQDLD